MSHGDCELATSMTHLTAMADRKSIAILACIDTGMPGKDKNENC